MAAMRNGSVYCENMFWSTAQTPCVHGFLNCLGSEGLMSQLATF